jgi:hypothetical protein
MNLLALDKDLPLPFLFQSLFEIEYSPSVLTYDWEYDLQHTCIRAGDDDDLSRQIRDVL